MQNEPAPDDITNWWGFPLDLNIIRRRNNDGKRPVDLVSEENTALISMLLKAEHDYIIANPESADEDEGSDDDGGNDTPSP